jgi:hypothetical protein
VRQKPSNAWRRWLTDCRQDDDGWQGRAFVPGWGAELHLRLWRADGAEPSPAQLRSLAELLSRRDDLRGRVQRRLFRHYKDDVRGVVPASDAPPLRRSVDIWPLMSEPEVWVDHRPWKRGTTFVLAFECQWDREHGLGVRVQGSELWTSAGQPRCRTILPINPRQQTGPAKRGFGV